MPAFLEPVLSILGGSMGGVPRHSACDHAFRYRQPVQLCPLEPAEVPHSFILFRNCSGLIVPIDGHRR